MTVQELCELFVDDGLQTINLWSHNTEGVIWTGTAEEVYDTEYADMEVSSIDNSDIKVSSIDVLNNSYVCVVSLIDNSKIIISEKQISIDNLKKLLKDSNSDAVEETE